MLGAVFLTVTGAEALYADLGHFGRRPIQWAWFLLVFPALTLNYLGQGALVLGNPMTMSDPFYLMYPKWALLPVVILATAATIIASQAVITGAFSMVRQGINLGFLPRMEILFTSETNTGQIFVPSVNAVLFIGVIFLVLSFKTSDALATAYGISVTGAMVVTSIMAFEFVRARWNWSLPVAVIALAPLVVLEMIFLGANLLKIHDGGYIPIMIATAFTVVMWTWRRGTAILMEKTRHTDIPLASFVSSIERKSEHSLSPGPGYGDLPDQRSGIRPRRLAAQSQAQPCAPRSQRHLDDPHDQQAARAKPRPLQGRADFRAFLPRRAAVRLHGIAERLAGLGDIAQDRAEVRHHVDLLLSRPPQAGAGRQVGHALLAGPALHRPRQRRCQSLGLLPSA